MGTRMAAPIYAPGLRRDRRIAKIAMARKLSVRMYWMWRKEYDYQQLLNFGSHVGQLETGNGVK
jgi:transposase